MKKWGLVLLSLCLAGCVAIVDGNESEYPIVEPVVIVDPLDEVIAEMSLEEKIAQMLMIRHPAEYGADLVSRIQPGGYIFFGKDFERNDATSFLTMSEEYQALSKNKMLMGVDEEGGIVNRVSNYYWYRELPFSSPGYLYNNGGLDLIRSDTIEKSDLLKSLGINLNFAPVADVASSDWDYIYPRTVSLDVGLTSEVIKATVQAMNEKQIGSVLKHFPGYGNNEDTHMGIAYDYRDQSTFYDHDFIPFKAGIDSGASMVLVSHNVVYAFDEVPASLSAKVHQVLRNDLHFEGVIITDDIIMAGITELYTNEEALIKAIEAGNDMITCQYQEGMIEAVVNAVEVGRLYEDQINQSVKRILVLKQKLGLN